MKPLSLDTNEGIEDASEYQNGSCNRQGGRDTWVYGESFYLRGGGAIDIE